MVVRFQLQDGKLVYMLTLRTRLGQANSLHVFILTPSGRPNLWTR